MITSFRISESVSDNAVSFGKLSAPSATPDSAIVMYDYSGKHLENISTFPERSKSIPAQYDAKVGGWYLTNIYASDAKITNKFFIRKGVTREVPLYYRYITTLPLLASSAQYAPAVANDGYPVGMYIVRNAESLQYEYQISDRLNTNLTNVYIHNAEFIPYAVHHNVAVTDFNSRLFYIYIYSNGSKDLDVHKIKFKAIDTNDRGMATIDNHYEYLSVNRTYSPFNINYDFKDGYGADLLGYSYEGSNKNPLTYMDSTTLISGHNDPDRYLGRPNGKYSLIYHYATKTYIGVLSDRLKSDTQFMQKPVPWLTIYSNSTMKISSANVNITNTNSLISLNLIEPGANPRTYTFTINNKSTLQVAAEINNSGAPFSAYPLLRLTNITQDKLWIDTSTRYTNVLTPSIPTAQFYDMTQDGGIILRSAFFFVRYTAEPTIYAKPPAASTSNNVEWNPSIKFGGYASDDGNSYFINEYASQGWSNRLGFPYKDVTGETAFMLDTHTIQCRKYPIYNDENQLVLLDTNGGTLNSNIEGIDALRGLIFLKEGVSVKTGVNEMYISYSYEEQFVSVPVDLNPLPGHSGKLNKYYVVSITPLVSQYGETKSSTISVEVVDSLPTTIFSDGKMVIAVFLVVDTYTKDLYHISPPKQLGGGLKRSISADVLNAKVPDLQSFTDLGVINGLRFPANCALLVDLPSFLLQGSKTILTSPYTASSINNNTLTVYGASNISPGTVLRVYSGLVGSQSYEECTVQAASDHETVKIETPLSNSYNVGAPVVLIGSKNAQFTDEEINTAVSKFMTAGSHYFLSYRDQ